MARSHAGCLILLVGCAALTVSAQSYAPRALPVERPGQERGSVALVNFAAELGAALK